MSNSTETKTADTGPGMETQPQQVAPKSEEETPTAQATVKKGHLAIVAVIALTLLWYLAADRFTPYTDQARVQGYVIGVAPKVGGLVTQVWAKNNLRVEKDQPLFQIDTSQFDIALEKARSDLETSRRQVDAGSSAVAAARANLVASQANEKKAEQDFTRLRRLREQDPGTISIRRLEVSQATLEQSQAAVVAASAGIQQAIEQMGGEDQQSNAILKTSLAAVAKAELDLADTTIKASLQGMITDLRTDVGQYAGTGSPVLTLVSMHDIWITADFTENNLGNLKVGSQVEILFDVLPGEIFPGRIRSIGLGISAGQAAAPGTLPTISNSRDWLRPSQRFPVIVEFDVAQSNQLREHMRIGGQATVMAYASDHGILRLLGKAYIRMMSIFSYAY